MSENLQQNKIMENLQEELDRIDEKYPDDNENDNCARCFEKLDIYGRYLPDLMDNTPYDNFRDEFDIVPYSNTIEDSKAKIQHELNVARDCLDNRKDIEKQAIDSLSEGKHISQRKKFMKKRLHDEIVSF